MSRYGDGKCSEEVENLREVKHFECCESTRSG